MKFYIMQFSPFLCYFISLGPNTFLNTYFQKYCHAYAWLAVTSADDFKITPHTASRSQLQVISASFMGIVLESTSSFGWCAQMKLKEFKSSTPPKSNPWHPHRIGGNVLGWQTGLWSTKAKVSGIVLRAAWH
jgi:hypothetical protein